MRASLLSVNIGLPKDVPWQGRTVHTGSYRLGMHLDRPDLPQLLVAHRRPGFSMRVVTEGAIEAGDEIVWTAADPWQLSVADTVPCSSCPTATSTSSVPR